MKPPSILALYIGWALADLLTARKIDLRVAYFAALVFLFSLMAR